MRGEMYYDNYKYAQLIFKIELDTANTNQQREVNTLSRDDTKHNTNSKTRTTKIMMTNDECNELSYQLMICVLFVLSDLDYVCLISALSPSPRTRNHCI